MPWQENLLRRRQKKLEAKEVLETGSRVDRNVAPIVTYRPLRASRRPSSVNSALRSSGLPFTSSRTTHPRSTAARNGHGFLSHPMQELPLHRLSVSSFVQFVEEVPRGHVDPPPWVLMTLARLLADTGALKGAMSMPSMLAPMATRIRCRHVNSAFPSGLPLLNDEPQPR
jgi:hypothetical protein